MAEASTSAAAVPSAEEILALLEAHGGKIDDTRALWTKPSGGEPAGEDEKAVEEYFRSRANWQLALQGVLNSLTSREVGP